MATDTLQNESRTATAWEKALDCFKQAESAAMEAVDCEHEAEAAAIAAHPRVAEYFDTYLLRIGMDRDDAVRFATMGICVRDFSGRTGMPLYPEEERAEYEAKLVEVRAEAERVADEFMAYQAREREVQQQFKLDELDQKTRAAWERWGEVRDALMAIPAQDHAGLLVKLEIALDSDWDHVRKSALADARRLLSGES